MNVCLGSHASGSEGQTPGFTELEAWPDHSCVSAGQSLSGSRRQLSGAIKLEFEFANVRGGPARSKQRNKSVLVAVIVASGSKA